MASRSTGWQPTARDDTILAALHLLPLTCEQLFKWSQRFDAPFTRIDDARRRLRKLHAAGLVRRWPLAVASRGSAPYYHRLSPAGYRFLQRDPAARPERKRAFASIGPALHYHALALSEFIVHVGVAAHRLGVEFTNLFPENAYRVELGKQTLSLDWRFTLQSPTVSRTYNVELDNSTETVLSPRDADSVARKIRLLDAHDGRLTALDPRRAVTLFVTTRSRARLLHILHAAGSLVRNPGRTLIVGVFLPEFLALADPLTAPCFLDHRGRPLALWPETASQTIRPGLAQLAAPAAVC